MYSLEEAKNHVLKEVLKLDPSDPIEHRPKIMDEYTFEFKLGWVFSYNSEAYLATGLTQFMWCGPGPILFNKYTGEVRRFNAVYSVIEVAEDYERELEAGDNSWCLVVEQFEFMPLALRLKKIFSISGTDAIRLAKRAPGPLFKGQWRQLMEFSKVLDGSKILVVSKPDLLTLEYLGWGRWSYK